MGNYQSDTSAVVSPDSSFPSVLYNATGSIRFRGFRKDDSHRILEEERNPLMSGSGSSNCNHTDDDSEEDDSDNDDDETAGLLSAHRRKCKRSPASMRQQLTIDIPLDESSLIRYQRGIGTPGSETDGHGSDLGGNCGVIQRDVSFDGQSIGGISLMPNFSPTSLHEKNLRLVDDDDDPHESSKADENERTCTENGQGCKPKHPSDLCVDFELGSSIMRGSASELTMCTLHPLQQSGDSLGSTNESDSSKLGGEGTQSEYLSSEPRSRSLSPEVMTILSKYCNSFDSSRSVSPESSKRGKSRRSGKAHQTKLSSSESNKSDIEDWLDQRRRPCLKHSNSSISSTTSSVDVTSHDLTLRARSLDFSDNPSGMATPDSDLFAPGDVGLKTAASMEQIQKELVNLEQEIADMSSKFLVLGSRDNLHTVDPVNDMPSNGASGSGDGALANVLRVLVRHRSRDEVGMTRSLSACDEQSDAEALAAMLEENDSVGEDLNESRMWRYSYHHQGQYVWDYQSDLASPGKTLPPQNRGIIDHWGTLSESGESPQHTSTHSHSRSHSGAQSPTFDHILSHLRQSHHSSMDSDIPHASSLSDLYIDDGLSDLSGLVTGDPKLQVDGLLQAAPAATNSDATSLDSTDSIAYSCDTASVHQGTPPAHTSPYTRLWPQEVETEAVADAGSRPQGGLVNDPGIGRCEFTDNTATNRLFNMQQQSGGILSVGPRVDLLTYAKQEWKGGTAKAHAILKGYEEISHLGGGCSLRRVRGDNYCALRAVLFQALRTGAPLLAHLGCRDAILQKLSIFTGAEYSYLQEHWTFANRLHRIEGSVVETAKMCIALLFEKIEEVTYTKDRERLTELIFNQSSSQAESTSATQDAMANANATVDVVLMEGVKLVLLLAVQELFVANKAGRVIPSFAELMFARDSSDTLRGFVRNHLNTVGDSGGLEQIEMFLLGYALGIHIQVYRPAYYGQSDFCTSYTDDGPASSLHTVTLIAEDDRHYNVLL